MQGALGYQAEKQQYLNNLTYKKATDEFSRWSSGMQAKQANLNNSYSYWQQKINYGQEVAYANSVRNFELGNAINSAEDTFRARSSSGAEYARNNAALSDGAGAAGVAG